MTFPCPYHHTLGRVLSLCAWLPANQHLSPGSASRIWGSLPWINLQGVFHLFRNCSDNIALPEQESSKAFKTFQHLLFPTRSACTHSYLQFLPAFLVYITFQAFFQMLSLTCLYPKTYLIFKILLSLYRFLLEGRKAPSLSISLNTHCILKFSIVFF